MKLTGRRYGRLIVAALILGALAWAGWRQWAARRADEARYGASDARAPEGVRIKVEVLNATRTRGLARRATLYLRDRGFDVVGSGTSTEQRDSTVVLDRSAHPEWAFLVGRAMNAKVVAEPDSSRYLDVTVILGADWRPPAKPFYP
ncbi:MAG TPA: LytR C-terminal domain-containing protein [Gemmatimonadaceae bacterium]|nr:LytR C-terminal domain-containing protein [Gemmatimonadaceae bacterium]